VGGTGLGSCPAAGIGTSGAETLDSTTRLLTCTR